MTQFRRPSREPRWLLRHALKVNAQAVLSGLVLAVAGLIGATGQSSDAAPREPFAVWRADFAERAAAKGHDPALIAATFAGVEPDLALIRLDRDQPEFVRPLWEYLDSAVSESRRQTGRERLAEEAALLTQLEGRYGPPAEVITAIWGLESAYGAVIGDHDVVQALATLAWDGRRRALFERELMAVLTILASGAVDRSELIGGWAGAMGQTQFMPSTFVRYAVDHDGDGRKNLWSDRGDALASAAGYLSDHGWRRGAPWGVEVRLPEGFNHALADGRRNRVADWARLGVTRADGASWDEGRRAIAARLLSPAGARGPAFLTFANYDVIKRYNNSTAYALAVGLLSDALAGRGGVIAPWPRDEQPLARTEIEELQRRLSALGYDTAGVDGRIGPNTRKALRAWQADRGLAPDAFATVRLLDQLRALSPG